MLKKTTQNVCKLVLFASAIGISNGARAQSVNYPQLEELFNEAVTTSATGKPLKASQAPVPMIIISRDQIRRSGASNLASALQNFAGIDVNRFGSSQYEVAIRGGTEPGNPRLLVLVNGRQVYLDHYGLTNWEGIGVNPEDIRQIEVVKGPNSALYGFNASQGVVNIITINPLHEKIRSASVVVGTGNEFEARGTLTLQPNENIGIRFSGGYARQDALKQSGLAFFKPVESKSKRQSVNAEIIGKISENSEAMLSYSYNQNEGRYVSPTYSPGNQMFRTHGFQGRVISDTNFGLMTASGFYNKLINSFSDIAPGVPPAAFHNQVFGAQISDVLKLGAKDTIRVALEYRNNMLSYNPDLSGTTKSFVYSASGMYDRVISEKASFTIAGRWDHVQLSHGLIPAVKLVPFLPAFPITAYNQTDFDRSFNVWSANAGLVFNPTDNDTLRITAARGSQAPSLVSLGLAYPFGQSDTGVGVLAGRPSVNPSISYTIDVGYDRTIEQVNGKFRLGLFHNWVNDVIQFPSITDAPFIVPPLSFAVIRNGGNYRSYGAEIDLSGRTQNGITWGINYTYTVVNDQTVKVDPSLIPENNAIFGLTGVKVQSQPVGLSFLTPRHKANAQIGYSDQRFDVDIYARFRSKTSPFIQFLPGSLFPITERPANITMDVRLAYKPIEVLQVSIFGENLTGNKAATLTTADAPRRIKFSLTASF
jgi:outer membrane receptor for ferrienterochelin and colicins